MSESPFAGLGVFAQPDTEPPMNTIFAQLRDIAKRQGHFESYSELARTIGAHPQHASQWATGSDGRRPPWNVIMYLLTITSHRLVGTADAWSVVPVEDGPQ